MIERKFKSSLARVLGPFLSVIPLHNISVDSIKSVIVVRQHNQLGDMLCCVPLLRALKNRLPEASITLVTSPINYMIMLHNPFVDEVLLYDKRHVVKFHHQLRSRHFDLAVVPCTVSVSVTSDFIAYFSSATLRVGPDRLHGRENPTGFLHNVRVALDWKQHEQVHQTARNLEILKPLGITTSDLQVVVGLTDQEKSWATSFLRSHFESPARLIGYHPGAGKAPNRWPAELFAQVANILSAKFDARTVVTSGPFDGEATESFLSTLDHKPIIVLHRTIREVAAILDRLDLFITNDTGVMHVASGTSVPVLSLFGPTDPNQWAPIGKKNRFIVSDNKTMESLSLETVTNTALEMLEKA